MKVDKPKCADLTVREVAAELGICPETVRKLIKKKELEAYRFGERAFRVTREALDAFKYKRSYALKRDLGATLDQ